MIEWMVSSCILILAVIALRYLLRGKISLRLQYALWALVLVRLLVPVSFGSTDISVMSMVERAPMMQAAESVREVGVIWQTANGAVEGYPAGRRMPDTPVTVAPSVSHDQFGRMESALTLRKLLLPVWWIGAAVTLLVFLCANLRFAERLRKSRRPMTVEGASLPVYVAEERAVPCLFGLFRPAIYVTQSAAEDPVLLRHTVAHETTHFCHGDHVWALLRAVCLALHWWDPLVWWAAKLSRQDGELACDEATIRALGEGERAAYGRTLIRMACGRGVSPLLTATTMDGGKTSLHERIVLLAKKPRTAVTAAIAVVLAAVLCVGCTFTGAKKDETVAEPDTLAGYMAALTVDDVAGWNVKQYPNITLSRLVTAMNDAAAHEITPEEAAQAEGSNTAEDENFERFISISLKNGKYLMVACGAAADIVCVSDLSAALSSTYPAEKIATAYFRDHDLYQLLWDGWEEQRDEPVPDQLESLPDKAELTTQTFTYQDLTLEVTDVYDTGKDTVRDDMGNAFPYDIYVVCPGSVLTVLEAPTFLDTDGVEHGDFLYYSDDGTQRLELWPGMTVEIEGGSAIVDESFGVLVFQMYSGM